MVVGRNTGWLTGVVTELFNCGLTTGLGRTDRGLVKGPVGGVEGTLAEGVGEGDRRGWVLRRGRGDVVALGEGVGEVVACGDGLGLACGLRRRRGGVVVVGVGRALRTRRRRMVAGWVGWTTARRTRRRRGLLLVVAVGWVRTRLRLVPLLRSVAAIVAESSSTLGIILNKGDANKTAIPAKVARRSLLSCWGIVDNFKLGNLFFYYWP
jgi:hypothetical protein